MVKGGGAGGGAEGDGHGEEILQRPPKMDLNAGSSGSEYKHHSECHTVHSLSTIMCEILSLYVHKLGIASDQ